MRDKRTKFIEQLSVETSFSREDANRLMTNIPIEYLDKAIETYNYSGVQGLELFACAIRL